VPLAHSVAEMTFVIRVIRLVDSKLYTTRVVHIVITGTNIEVTYWQKSGHPTTKVSE